MRLNIGPLKFKAEAYRRNFIVSIRNRALWIGWFSHHSPPINHPTGKAWGLWKEDGEWFSLCGPLLMTLGRV
ncbi:hypothetical protein FHS63_000488 [Azospirillum doebereinerae]